MSYLSHAASVSDDCGAFYSSSGMSYARIYGREIEACDRPALVASPSCMPYDDAEHWRCIKKNTRAFHWVCWIRAGAGAW